MALMAQNKGGYQITHVKWKPHKNNATTAIDHDVFSLFFFHQNFSMYASKWRRVATFIYEMRVIVDMSFIKIVWLPQYRFYLARSFEISFKFLNLIERV